MSEEAAFLEALKANPADDTTRLVYADWLDEHGETAQAEYLRLVAEFAQAEKVPTSGSEAVRAVELAEQLPEDWRIIVGSRFDVIIDRYVDKIRAIKWIREVTGDSIGEAKVASESLPNPVHVCMPFEVAVAVHASAQRSSAAETRIAPSAHFPRSSNESYTLAVYCNVDLSQPVHTAADAQQRENAAREAREALISVLIAAFGIGSEEANSRVVFGQHIVLGTGLSLQEARKFRLKLGQLPPYKSNRGWFFWITRYQPEPA
jgi:uncharacterized protein (TIGR02996 family)